jgi:hypothetical protein
MKRHSAAGETVTARTWEIIEVTESRKSKIIGSLIGLLPYLLVAWASTKFNHSITFWNALGFIAAARLLFGFTDELGGILAWRLHGRRIAVANALKYLRVNKFPLRYFNHDDFLNYMARVEADDSLEPRSRSAAAVWVRTLALFENMGILIGARMNSASNAALEIYSPRAAAPDFTYDPSKAPPI